MYNSRVSIQRILMLIYMNSHLRIIIMMSISIQMFNTIYNFITTTFNLVISEDVLQRLHYYKVPTISEWDNDLGVSWFIPREVIKKKTRRGKDFYIIRAIDNTSKTSVIKVWGVDPRLDIIYTNRPYMAKLSYSEQWGFSTRSMRYGWKLIG